MLHRDSTNLCCVFRRFCMPPFEVQRWSIQNVAVDMTHTDLTCFHCQSMRSFVQMDRANGGQVPTSCIQIMQGKFLQAWIVTTYRECVPHFGHLGVATKGFINVLTSTFLIIFSWDLSNFWPLFWTCNTQNGYKRVARITPDIYLIHQPRLLKLVYDLEQQCLK